MLSLRLCRMAAVAHALAVSVACTTTTRAGDGGLDWGNGGRVDAGDTADSGEDAGPLLVCCAAAGASCGPMDCCENLNCSGGICAPSAPICGGFGQPCQGDDQCCVPGFGDAGLPRMSCFSLAGDSGFAVCRFAQYGEACGPGVDCAPTLVCLGDAGCQVPLNVTDCTADAPCQIGDDCSAHFNAGIADPCHKDGLFCGNLGLNASQTAYVGVCARPFVVEPPSFPAGHTSCDPSNDLCLPARGSAQRTAPVCGTFWNANSGNPVCLEACTSTFDCSSLAELCVGGACVPVYCYVSDGATATTWSSLQGSPISADAGVLFQPCNLDGDTPSYCLPQADPNYDATGHELVSGICFRVGGVDAGGLGASCDPNLYGNNPSAMCAAGLVCERGTCLPWCELQDRYVLPCTGDTGCEPSVDLPLPANPTIVRSTGVCMQECNPYQLATDAGDGCEPFVAGAVCIAQPPVCKLNGEDNYLAAGVCLAGVANPIAVGGACDPVSGWTDPCESGSMCVLQLDGGSFDCAQICDPAGNVATSICPAPTTCQALGCANASGTCTHQGVCL